VWSTHTWRGYSRYGVAGKGRSKRTFSRVKMEKTPFIGTYQEIERPEGMTNENWDKWNQKRKKVINKEKK